MSRFNDTIAALATPVGESAIAVLRASGPDTRRLLGDLCPRAALTPRLVRHADYRDRTGQLLDDVLCVFYAAPHSYTGEDSLEISCHGNPFIAQRILADLLARGCRAAEPGEFTQRAFLNGRIDLSQAEAVMDVIHARSDRALAAANQQLRGALGRQMNAVIDRLLDTLAQVEAYIDFPDEDLPAEDLERVRKQLNEIQAQTSRLLATRPYGDMLRNGIRVAIVGTPNVGKSSLLNRLVGKDRVLVSPEPGTTRDFVEEPVILGEYRVLLVDTAGFNENPASLEARGIEKSRECLRDADIVLAVVDASLPSPTLPIEVQQILVPNRCIIVINKVDLVSPPRLPAPSGVLQVAFSAQTGIGVDQLIRAICSLAERHRVEIGDDLIAINARHAHALSSANQALDAALANLKDGGASELLASDLRSALRAFEEIAGKIDGEQVLDRLFATFCIGK